MFQLHWPIPSFWTAAAAVCKLKMSTSISVFVCVCVCGTGVALLSCSVVGEARIMVEWCSNLIYVCVCVCKPKHTIDGQQKVSISHGRRQIERKKHLKKRISATVAANVRWWAIVNAQWQTVHTVIGAPRRYQFECLLICFSWGWAKLSPLVGC